VKQFSVAKKWLSDINSETAGKLITAASDVALVVSDAQKGVIRDVSFGSDELAVEVADNWVGKPWAETVTSESRHKHCCVIRPGPGCRAGAWSITATTTVRTFPSSMRR